MAIRGQKNPLSASIRGNTYPTHHPTDPAGVSEFRRSAVGSQAHCHSWCHPHRPVRVKMLQPSRANTRSLHPYSRPFASIRGPKHSSLASIRVHSRSKKSPIGGSLAEPLPHVDTPRRHLTHPHQLFKPQPTIKAQRTVIHDAHSQVHPWRPHPPQS